MAEPVEYCTNPYVLFDEGAAGHFHPATGADSLLRGGSGALVRCTKPRLDTVRVGAHVRGLLAALELASYWPRPPAAWGECAWTARDLAAPSRFAAVGRAAAFVTGLSVAGPLGLADSVRAASDAQEAEMRRAAEAYVRRRAAE